jgi:hypothetical protein
MVYEIKLASPKDVKNLNDAALDYEGKLLVNCGSTSIDARSLLGLFTLIGRKGVKLVAPDHENPNKFAEIVKRIDN